MSAECGNVLISGDQSLICTIAAHLWRPPLLSPCLSAPVSVRGKTTAAAAALPTLLPWPPAPATAESTATNSVWGKKRENILILTLAWRNSGGTAQRFSAGKVYSMWTVSTH